ncbi:MAG: methionyl-tRNA formyltransferase, partial [Patescibacteria group bacterium]
MNYIFFGTPEFAVIILEKLINAGFIPVAVICNPDKPVGRKKIITSPPTKVLAEKYKINILQPEILANYKLQITNY